MPSRDVNAATRLAEASWSRDNNTKGATVHSAFTRILKINHANRLQTKCTFFCLRDWQCTTWYIKLT